MKELSSTAAEAYDLARLLSCQNYERLMFVTPVMANLRLKFMYMTFARAVLKIIWKKIIPCIKFNEICPVTDADYIIFCMHI
jgi:hypothetical protein